MTVSAEFDDGQDRVSGVGPPQRRTSESTASTTLARFTAAAGHEPVATLLGAMTAIALIALVRLRRVPGLLAVAVLLAANTSTWLLKTRLLSRPDLGLREITSATHNSLPSGHTTVVFSAVIAFVLVAPRRARRPVAILAGALLIIATATAVLLAEISVLQCTNTGSTTNPR